MRASGPRGAGRRRPPGGGDTPSPPASLAGCCSAPRRAPLWTCLVLCAALRTLLASPSNEGRAMGRSSRRPGAGGRGGACKSGALTRVGARGALLPRRRSHASSRINMYLRLSLAFRSLSLLSMVVLFDTSCGVLGEAPAFLGAEAVWGLGSWEPGGKRGFETRAWRLGAAGAH